MYWCFCSHLVIRSVQTRPCNVVSLNPDVYDAVGVQGSVGDEMFFVVKGEFEVLKGRGIDCERLGFIGQGGFFGENCIIEVRNCTICSDSTAKLLV